MQLTDPVLHPVFLAHLLDHEIPDWETMAAEKLREALAEIGPYSLENWSKIQAARTVRQTYAPYDDFRIFNFVAHALNGRIPNFLLFEPLDLPEALGGARMMTLLKKAEFSAEVLRYVAVLCDSVQAGPLPAPLQGTEDFVKMPMKDPDRVKEATDYMIRLDELLMMQLRAYGR